MSHSRHQRGQATVEFALIVPLVMVLLLALVQVAMVAYAQIAATHLAREVARAVVVEPGVDVDELVDRIAPAGAHQARVDVMLVPLGDTGHTSVEVVVSYEVAPTVAIFRPLSKVMVVRAEVKMLLE